MTGAKVEEQTNAELLARVQTLEDIEQIKVLQMRFWRACDGELLGGPTHPPEEIAELFTLDAVWDVTPVEADGVALPGSVAQGRDEIMRWFARSQIRQPFVFHLGGMPIIEVDGATAIATWRVVNASTVAGGAYWGAAHYDAEYRRTPAGWRISMIRMTRAFRTSFEDGWAARRFIPG
jgi:SnoaL-like domain